MRAQTVYKIVDRESWDAAKAEGVYRGAPVDLADGFIHLSARNQVMDTARKHFRGMRGLLLVAIRSERLGDDLKWEKSRGNELFPHLYADLNIPEGSKGRLKATPIPRVEREASRPPRERSRRSGGGGGGEGRGGQGGGEQRGGERSGGGRGAGASEGSSAASSSGEGGAPRRRRRRRSGGGGGGQSSGGNTGANS